MALSTLEEREMLLLQAESVYGSYILHASAVLLVWKGYMEYMDWSYGTPLGIGILAYTHVFVVCSR